MLSDKSNVINIDAWKKGIKENGFSEYIKVLSFTDLVNESQGLIEKLGNDCQDADIIKKSKMIMNEFKNRLEKESKSLANTVNDLTNFFD